MISTLPLDWSTFLGGMITFKYNFQKIFHFIIIMEIETIFIIAATFIFLLSVGQLIQNKIEGFSGRQEATPAPFIPLECPTFPHYYNTICGQSPVRQNSCSPAMQPSVQPAHNSCMSNNQNPCQCQGGCLAKQQQQGCPKGNTSLVQPGCNSTQPVPAPLGCYPQTQFTQHRRPMGCAGRCLLHRHYT